MSCLTGPGSLSDSSRDTTSLSPYFAASRAWSSSNQVLLVAICSSLATHLFLSTLSGAVPTRFGTSFYALERVVECKDALEETVFSQKYKAWIRAGNAGQSCCVAFIEVLCTMLTLSVSLQSALRGASSARRQ